MIAFALDKPQCSTTSPVRADVSGLGKRWIRLKGYRKEGALFLVTLAQRGKLWTMLGLPLSHGKRIQNCCYPNKISLAKAHGNQSKSRNAEVPVIQSEDKEAAEASYYRTEESKWEEHRRDVNHNSWSLGHTGCDKSLQIF